MPDFAIQLGPDVTDHTLPGRLAAIAQQGFDAVEIAGAFDVPASALAGALRHHALAPAIVDLAVDGSLASDPARAQDFRAAIGTALERARAIGSWHVSCPVGTAPESAETRDVLRTIVENLRFAAEVAQPSGLRILVDTAPAFAGQISVLPRLADTVAILDAVGRRNVSLLLDLAAPAAQGETVTRNVTRHLGRIGHVRLCRAEQGDPDTDALDFLPFLDQIGYRGWVGCPAPVSAAMQPSWLTRFPPRNTRGIVWGMPKEALRSFA